MRLLVLGAGGKTGGAVVQQAVAAGHQVTAFVHHAGQHHHPAGVTIREGDATDADSVADAVAGQDAVINTIGGKTPYKSITLEDDVAKAVIAAMQRHAVRRLLVTSSVGVGDSVANATAFLRILLKTFLRGATADKAAMERDVEASELDWTIARPAILNDNPASGDVRVLDPATGNKAHKIARADLAAWLVAQLGNTEHVHRAVTVATS